MNTARTCPQCQQLLAPHTGPGRPAVYCSAACRKKAHQARQAAQFRGEPIQIIREPAPPPAPKTVLRTRTVYKKPTRPELSKLLQNDPDFLDEILDDLTAFIAHRNIPKSTQQLLATRLGQLIIRLYRAQSQVEPHSDLEANATGMTSHDWASAAISTGQVAELLEAVEAHRKQVVQDEATAKHRRDQEQEQIDAKHRKADQHLKEAQQKTERLEAAYQQTQAKAKAADHAYQVWQKHGRRLAEKTYEQEQELQKTRRLTEVLEQRVATIKQNGTNPGASFYRL